MIFPEFLKYIDCFGTHFNFYTEKRRKFYTPFGGILSLFSIFFGIIIFIYINLDDFSHNSPISTTSVEKKNYTNIKFGNEKIWIPWRIRDFGGKTVEHEGLLFPIIYYYKGIRNDTLQRLEISYDFINYKLCNETSMINNSNDYWIDIDINQLYCIDMEDLDIGGSWDSDFLNLITFDLYVCKNGIDYDKDNTNCSTYESIAKAAGENDCYEFEMYYPEVQFQPFNKTTPIFVRYINYFYHLSRFSNKIDRLYLQQFILEDDRGWYNKNIKIYSHWGRASLNGDSYSTGNTRDLMNEGSTSRLYSFNIYLKSDVVFYNRRYKKISLIFADGLPIVNIVFIFFKIIAKIFKISSGNRKLTELLFENLKKKKIVINNEHYNQLKLKPRNNYDKKLNSVKRLSNNNKNNVTINNTIVKNINDVSSIKLTYNEPKKKITVHKLEKKNSFENKQSKRKSLNEQYSQRNNINRKIIKKTSHNDFQINYYNNKNMNKMKMYPKIDELFSIKNNDISSNIYLSDKKVIQNVSNLENNNILDNKSKVKYVKKTLFPYRYYLCSIFINNIDIYKGSIFFSKKFVAVYNFICQLFDISSYLILQKEFEIMKNTLLVDKYKDIMENREKINVNDLYFNVNMKECLSSKKFSILGKLHQNKNE